MNRLLPLMWIALALCATGTHAQTLNDPMRPPLFTAADTEAKAGPVLQTIVIGKERRYAIISGERIAPGGAYGEAKVVRIAENEVTLRDATGDTVLKLVPQIKKQIAAPKPVGRDAVPGEKGKP